MLLTLRHLSSLPLLDFHGILQNGEGGSGKSQNGQKISDSLALSAGTHSEHFLKVKLCGGQHCYPLLRLEKQIRRGKFLAEGSSADGWELLDNAQ